MDTEEKNIYNSRIIQVYLQYIAKVYPGVDIDAILRFADMTQYEVQDQAHWFTQDQVDRFQEAAVLQTNNLDIAREAGRFSVSSAALGVAKQYTLGLISISSIFHLMEKLYPILSRGATAQARKLGRNSVEIISRPKPGVREKLYQCENRIGTFESLPELFGGKSAKIDHTTCFHRGDEYCRYVVSWEDTRAIGWKRARNIVFVFGGIACGILFFFLPLMNWILATVIWGYLFIILANLGSQAENQQLKQTINTQGNAAKERMEEMERRHNDALLVQEIGQATATILDVESLLQTIALSMRRRLDFDRGIFMLANGTRTKLVYADGYGHSTDQLSSLRSLEFNLGKEDSQGLFVKSFREQRPFLIENVSEITAKLSRRSLEFLHSMGSQSLICVPILYEKESLGILAVDNVGSKRPFTQSDMSLLMGVASQTATSIVNARSYEKLQESEKKYRDLVENANSIIMRVNTDGLITFFNEYAQKFFEYEEKEIVGRSATAIILPANNQQNSMTDVLESLRYNAANKIVQETQLTLREGRKVTVAWTYKGIFGEKDQLVGILCIGNDITELREAAETNQVLERQLQQAQKMEAIGTLAGGIAHDFNNILSAILGYTELALFNVENGSALRKKLEAVLTAGHRAKELVQQILAFSRQTDDERKPVQLHLIVNEALKLLRASLPSTIEIRQEISKNGDTILGNATQIHQIVMNLCTNAHHAMAEKGGILDVSLSSVAVHGDNHNAYGELNPGNYVRLSISDTGHGMSPSTLERIFEPYYTTKEKGVGTGLGLSVVHGIVKRNGGAIVVESLLGKGSTFHVLLPELEKFAKLTKHGSKVSIRGSERILLVDDEATLVDLGKEMLSNLGYTVECRTSSVEALEAFRSNPAGFDLVLTDLTMPNMTGDKLASALLDIRPDVPILICTGFNDQLKDSQIHRLGIREVLFKPLVLEELGSAIRRTLDQQR